MKKKLSIAGMLLMVCMLFCISKTTYAASRTITTNKSYDVILGNETKNYTVIVPNSGYFYYTVIPIKYIENGIAAHCTFHINSLMLCEESKKIKQKIIALDANVKNVSVQIYNNMNQMSRTVWMLRKTFYGAYPFIHRHKEKSGQ